MNNGKYRTISTFREIMEDCTIACQLLTWREVRMKNEIQK